MIEYYNVIHARICGNIVVIRAITDGIEDPNTADLLLLETIDTWHDVAANERPSERNVVSYLPYAFWRDTAWKYIQDGYGDILLLGEDFCDK